LTYRINPFTMFYIGATWGGKLFKDGYGYDVDVVQPDHTWSTETVYQDGAVWRLRQSQVFAKFQYLFRL
jgi:hypothetical protein